MLAGMGKPYVLDFLSTCEWLGKVLKIPCPKKLGCGAKFQHMKEQFKAGQAAVVAKELEAHEDLNRNVADCLGCFWSNLYRMRNSEHRRQCLPIGRENEPWQSDAATSTSGSLNSTSGEPLQTG